MKRRNYKPAALREQSPLYRVTGENSPSPGGEGRGEGGRSGADQLTCLDLFCGCGGFSLGMERAGFRVLAAIDPTHISGIERGLRNPGIKNVAKLARALGLSTAELCKGVDA